jgi:hypothetical protein
MHHGWFAMDRVPACTPQGSTHRKQFMNGRFFAMAMVALMALTFSAVAAQDAGSATNKFVIQHAYAPGSSSSLVYRIVEETTGEGDGMGNMKISSVLTLALSARKADAPAPTTLDMNFRRIQAMLQAGELNRDVDSSKPESLLPDMPLDVLTSVTFTAGLDSAGRIVSFTGAEAFMDKAKMTPAAPKEKQVMATSIDAGLRQLIEEPFVYLPAAPVAVGDTWKVTRKVYGLPIMGARRVEEEDLTCRLASVRKTDAGQVAVIDVTGKSTVIEGGSPTDPKTMQKTGQIEYNIDTGDLVSHHIALNGAGAMTMPEGKEMRFTRKVSVDTSLTPAAAPAKADVTTQSSGKSVE